MVVLPMQVLLAPTPVTSKSPTQVQPTFSSPTNADVCDSITVDFNKDANGADLPHQSPGYFDHAYFENDQNILTSSLSMGFLPIKLMIIIISTFSNFFIFFSTFVL
jgi:hypothetical protein